MKNWRVATVFLLFLTLVTVTACNPFGGEEETTDNLVEVVRGDLALTVSGSGNIEVSNEIWLSFGIAGKVDKIYVEEGDEVKEGEVLARLDTDALELALVQVQVAQTKAQVDVIQARVTVTEAQVAVQTTEYALEQTEETYTVADIKVAQADVDEARRDLEEALWTLSRYDLGTPGWEAHQKIVNQTKARLNTAEDTLDAMLYGFSTEEVAIKKLQVETAKQSLELTQQFLKLAQQSLELAGQSLRQARKQLNEATITASFDGVIANVNVDEKDTVSATTTIIHLIDPNSMELQVQVDEIDVPEVKPGQRAIIEVDALPALSLEGKVSSISLLPTEESGVIVYDVKIDFDVPEGVGIRAGMSATADIIIAERNDVLLVPDRAIEFDNQGNSIVEVMVNGQIEERTVVPGISDGFQAEIVDGLKEGEMVERRARSK